MAQSFTSIRHFNHKVALCSMKDVVDEGGTMRLTREKVLLTWAKIEVRRGSFIGEGGFSIMQPLDRRTHIITLRYRVDLEITSAAWVYEPRLKSAPIWYKVLEILNDDGEHILVYCRLVEKSDAASPPVAGMQGQDMPQGVKL